MDTNPPQAPKSDKLLGNDSFRYAGAGIQFALTFLMFGLCGWWLDGRLGTGPWLMIAGILLGAAGAFYSLVRRLSPQRPRGSSGGADDSTPNRR